jgi:hypothetical protein
MSFHEVWLNQPHFFKDSQTQSSVIYVAVTKRGSQLSSHITSTQLIRTSHWSSKNDIKICNHRKSKSQNINTLMYVLLHPANLYHKTKSKDIAICYCPSATNAQFCIVIWHTDTADRNSSETSSITQAYQWPASQATHLLKLQSCHNSRATLHLLCQPTILHRCLLLDSIVFPQVPNHVFMVVSEPCKAVKYSDCYLQLSRTSLLQLVYL